MRYTFKEIHLRKDFASDKVRKISQHILSEGVCTILGMPAVGVSLFLKYLTAKNLGHTIYLDLYSLVDATTHDFYMLLTKELGAHTAYHQTEQELLEVCKNRLATILKKEKKVVVIINRFEELESVFSKKFLGSFRILRHEFGDRISFIFSITKPYQNTQPEALTGGNLYFFTKYFYFTSFKEKDLKELLSLESPEIKPTERELKKTLTLSGGHFQLLQLLLKTEKGKVNPLRDPFITLLLKQIYENLSYEQQKQLKKISLGRKTEIDNYLIQIGVVSSKNTSCKLFSPLLKAFILSQIPLKLPVKEQRLFSLLKKSRGKVLTKDAIFAAVWKENPEEASDWALDSLIYRLRKNQVFKKQGYTIENQKKQGYILLKNM